MKIYENGVIRDMTAEEIEEMEEQKARSEVAEKHRPFYFFEISEMLLRKQINTLSVDDQTAYRMKDFYPEYELNHEYKTGEKFVYSGDLYKVLQDHTSQQAWVPGTGTESIYTRINEQYDGSKYDPIPYNGNMALENGKYYTQNDILYRCTRDTVNPVYNALSELVGIYVEVVE